MTAPVGHPEALDAAAHATLADLAGAGVGERFYLAGSAALALHLAHRPARGLDLMSLDCRLLPPERRDLLRDVAARDPGVAVATARDGFLHLRSGQGITVKLHDYPYPLLAPPATVDGFPVAAPLDLSLMKLGAVISRGTRRDLVDLFLLDRLVPLDEALARSPEKFPRVGDFPLQALKALADLELAADEPMPPLLRPLDWDEVARWAEGAAGRLGRRHVGLDPAPARS